MARPLGVTILSALVLLASVIMILIGIAAFFVGLAFLIPGSPASGTTMILNGLLYFVIGVVLGIAGSGLMRLRPWAWGLAILAALVTLVYLGYNIYQASNSGLGVTLSGMVTLAIVAAIFVYLLSVSRAFRRPQPTM